MQEHLKGKGLLRVTKYADTEAYERNEPYLVGEWFKNVMLNEGIAEFEDVAAELSTAALPYNTANSHLGVGDSTVSSGVATSTDLLSTANTLYILGATTHPSRAGQVVTWRGVFGSGQANFNWREFTVRNSLTATGRQRNLNRAVSNQGTKAAGQTWTLDLALTLS